MTKQLRLQKIRKLRDSEGYEKVQDMLDAALGDSISPAICMNEGCDYTCEMQPDQREGWCEVCATNTVQSAFVIVGVY